MKRLLLICFAFLLIGCSSRTDSSPEQEMEQKMSEPIYSGRFVETHISDGYNVLIDMETRVQYLKFNRGYTGYMSVLLDASGKPLLYQNGDYSVRPSEKDLRTNTNWERFIEIYGGDGYHIIIDKETRVQYLKFNRGYDGYMSVFLDSEGKPILYEGKFPK